MIIIDRNTEGITRSNIKEHFSQQFQEMLTQQVKKGLLDKKYYYSTSIPTGIHTRTITRNH